ncbi:MAG: prephenate dehydrogenase [Gammaproteobacteria bacterium]|nr:prephenate dehydrogenase [Gammaproteobacteria bacterium]
MKFSMIGFGRFGRLLASALLPFGSVMVYDPHIDAETVPADVIYASLQQVVAADFLFLLVPISQFADCCRQVSSLLPAQTIVVDCCSVKVYPVNVMERELAPQQPLIATHPLFGPDSVKKNGGFQGCQIVFCPVRCSETQSEQLQTIFAAIGLEILITSAEDHDQQMATSQGLVHFIGRGLAGLNLKPQALATPDFQSLLGINHMVINDNLQLFIDMHWYNPYTRSVREKLIEQLEALNNKINREVYSD